MKCFFLAIPLAAALSFAGCTTQPQVEPPQDMAIEQVEVPAPSPLIIWEDGTMDNTQFSYYYWSEYFLYLESNAQQLPASLDITKPLAGQMYDQDTTWEDYMVARTLRTVEETMAMVYGAKAAGFVLSQQQEDSLQSMLDAFGEKALEMGFTKDGQPDLEGYFQDSYGPNATVETFTTYLHNAYLASAYSDYLYNQPTFSEEAVLSYVEEHAGAYTDAGVPMDDTLLPTIRTILFLAKDVANDESWNQAKEAAQTLYDTWRADGGKESDFSALASAYSQDKESGSRGGLFEGVTPGAISGQLATWTFQEDRTEGDSAVVSTDTGWAIVYYVAPGTTTAKAIQGERDLRNETYDKAFAGLRNQYPLEFQEDQLDIPIPDGLFTAQ